MKKILFIVGVAGFISLQGCSNDTKKEEASETNVDAALIPTENVGSDSIQTISTEPSVNADQQIANPSVQGSTAEGMNPAHGAPGHRCDIAVGEPLSSPPGKTQDHPPTINSGSNISTTPNIQIPAGSTNQPQIMQSAPVTGPTPAGMNPPHGEPGHDCAIAVGAPLKK